MKPIPCAVLGCTGLVGRQFVRLLDGHPFFDLSLLTASARSAGKPFAAAAGGEGRASGLVICETAAATVVGSGVRVVFSALPADAAGPLESELRQSGLLVFSNASAMRMEPDVPLLVPEVNPGHLELCREQRRRHGGFIVTNPNCVVAGLAIALKPLRPLGLRAVTVSTYQAVSGAGRRGVAALDIMGNVIPFIAGEEEKLAREARKILGTLDGGRVQDCALEVFPSCSRVAVKDGHLQSVSAEFAGDVGLPELREALAGFTAEPQRLGLPTAPQSPIVVRDEADRPQPLLDADAGAPGRAAGMAVSVGRLRRQGRRFGFFLLVHNAVRGAAGGSLLNAELALRRGFVPGVEHD